MEPGSGVFMAEGRAGACGVRLELERGWAPWGGAVEGVLRLIGGDRPQKLQFCEVRLTTAIDGSGSSLPSGVSRHERVTVPAGQVLELPFSLNVGWGTLDFGSLGRLVAYAVPASFPWWPCVLSLVIEITPPAEFLQPATLLAELTGLPLGVWRVVSGGDGAAMTLRAPDDRHPLARIDLTLYRSPERVYGTLALAPREGARRQVQLRLSSSEPEEVLRTLKAAVDRVLAGTEFLPIPATRSVSTESLPIPAEGRSATSEELPRPAEAPERSAGQG